MGWVGVATLIATACYVLYRFPPRTWALEPGSDSDSTTPRPPLPPPPPAVTESIFKKQTPQTPPRVNDDEDKPFEIPEIKPVLDRSEEEETQTTPKASAASAPALQVPVLNLNNENQTPKQNGSGKPPNPLPHTSGKVAKNEPAMMPPPPPSQSAASPSLMPPPSLPRPRSTGQQTQQPPKIQQSQSLSPGPGPVRYPPRSSPGGLRPPPSAAASQRGPPPGLSPSSSNSLAPPTQSSLKPSLKPSKNASSRRADIAPGYSQLDWAALTTNPKNNLRGANLPPGLIRVTPSMLQAQNGRKERDAWTSYQGKVYNISPYAPFHPGGKGELLRGAGKDSGRLFLEVHPWVNWDAILNECLVGILVSENEGENTLDAMD